MLYWQFWASFWQQWADFATAVTGADQPSARPDPHEEAMKKSDLEQSLKEQFRAQFLANANHDLRTPLNAVIGFAQLIESEMFGKIDNPQYLEYVKHIQDSGYELLDKIEEILGISPYEMAAPARKLANGNGATDGMAAVSKKHLVAVD